MAPMNAPSKAQLVRYLQAGRDAMVWKLDGISEYDARRPLTPTGTNLLGLVKHLASVELGYFTESFGRQCPVRLPWYDEGADDNADLWATAEETREDILELYRTAWRAAGETFEELDLDAPGRVPWWSPSEVTLGQIMVHMIAETNRHAGHADILREGIDGAAGLRPSVTNLPQDYDWPAHVARVEAAAAAWR